MIDLNEPLLPFLKITWHPASNGLSIEGNIADKDRALWVMDKAREALDRQGRSNAAELVVPEYAGATR